MNPGGDESRPILHNVVCWRGRVRAAWPRLDDNTCQKGRDIMRYMTQIEVEIEAEGPEEAAHGVLAWFHDGMMPVVEVWPIDENGQHLRGETRCIDTEDELSEEELAHA